MNTVDNKIGNKGTCVFLFDYTGIMAQPWLDAGYTCYIVDGQHAAGTNMVFPRSDTGRLWKVGMWFDNSSAQGMKDSAGELLRHIREPVDFLFGFPECTDLAVSGAMHFKKKGVKDPEFQLKAMRCVTLVSALGQAWDCPWALENPVSRVSTLWRQPDHRFHPWEYGGYLPVDDVHPTYPNNIQARDAYPKNTCIWSGGGFIMPEKKPVEKPVGYSAQHLKLGGKSLKTKNIRSATPRGFAKAVFEANHKEN